MKKVLILFIMLLFPLSVKGKDIEIKEIQQESISDLAREVEKPKIEGDTVTFNNGFCEENAQVTYRLKIQNNSNRNYILSLKNDSSKTGYAIDITGSVLEANSTSDVLLTITGSKIAANDMIDGSYKEENIVSLIPHVEGSKKINNPETSFLSISFVYILIILLAIIVIILHKQKIRRKLFILLFMASIIVLNQTGKTLADETNAINITSKVIYDSNCPTPTYNLVTTSVQKQFYPYGTFTTKGLKLTRDGVEVANFQPTLASSPDLNQIGNQTVKVKYNNHEFEYEINVRDNQVGDLITLEDGSRWYFLSKDNNNVNLLSVYLLKEASDGKLTFMTIKDKYNQIYSSVFDSNNKDYDESSIKTKLYTSFKTPYLNKLATEAHIDTSSIAIDLPDGELLSSLLGGATDGIMTGDDYNRYTAMFLRGYMTYWTKTKRNDTAEYSIHQDNGRVGYALDNKATQQYAIRPQMTISKTLLDQAIVKEDLNSDGPIDLVSSLGYIIYDVDNKTIIKHNQVMDSRYIDGLGEDSYHVGPETNEYIYPASVTKATTAMYALIKMKENGINLDSTVQMDQKIKQCSDEWYSSGGQRLRDYDTVSYLDLFYASLYGSSWDATAQLAVSLTTTPNGLGLDTSNIDPSNYQSCETLDKAFAEEMTQYVKNQIIGTNAKTNYVNTSGFMRDNHQTTLYETAQILGYAMKNTELYNIYKNPDFKAKYTSTTAVNNGKYFSINNPSSPIFGLEYLVGGKIGNAGWKDRHVHSGYNWAVYYEKDGHGYVIFTAEADGNLETIGNKNMINDQFLLYQWLFR